MKFLYIALLAWGLSFFAQKQTDRFTLSKIATVLIKDGKTAGDLSPLKQTFSYMGKGGQSYIFVSQDGEYILKLFRGSKLQFGFFHPKVKEKGLQDLKEALRSYQIAYDVLSNETGLVAIHLGQTSLDRKIEIIDKLKISHKISATNIPFVIQKRAVLVKEKIAQLMENRDVGGAISHLGALFSLIRNRMEKKIEDGDPNLAKNFGFIGSNAIEIDGGRFSLSNSPSMDPIERSKEDLQHWINANFPELSEPFDQLYKEFCRV